MLRFRSDVVSDRYSSGARNVLLGPAHRPKQGPRLLSDHADRHRVLLCVVCGDGRFSSGGSRRALLAEALVMCVFAAIAVARSREAFGSSSQGSPYMVSSTPITDSSM